jgi:ketosteroid isomerase-like protein
VEVARRYFERMDSADTGIDEVLELYGEDPVVHSSRAGVVRGREAIRQFYEDNIVAFRAHLDYRGYVDDVPENVPNVRARAHEE